MAKADSGQDQTVEDILASIRQAISADDQKRSADAPGARGEQPKLMYERRPGLGSAAVSPRDFAARDSSATVTPPAPAAADRSQMHDVIELAIEQALDGVTDGQAPATAPSSPPRMVTPPRPAMRLGTAPRAPMEPLSGRELPRPAAPPSPPQRPSLMSPRTNAAVTMSFDDLARTIAANTGRDLDRTVEEMLRPMLRGWLDDNLPTLVERLVREEIERVSRGRR
jgi:cell pole-organizing protein PopZ